MNNRIFKTGKRLQIALDSPERIEGFQEYLDKSFAYLFFDLDGKEAEEALHGEKFNCPYWMDKYHNRHNKKGENKYFCEYVKGYYEPLKLGEIKDGYKYVDSQPLDEEMEHQAENGGCVYEYRAYSFLRIWEKL